MVMIVSSYTTFCFALITSVSGLTLNRSQPEKRAQCAATLNVALSVAHRLQDHYYNSGSGMYNGGSLWTDANTLEDLHNLMLATGTDDFSSVADNSFIGRNANNPSTNWNSVLGGSNDDAGWIVLSLWKMADYKASRGQSNTAFLNAASKVYDIIEGQWDNVCGGGVWWSTAHTYKNAITNELFLLLSAQGFRRGFGQKYLDNAKKTWDWLRNSGMRNGDNLWNDGLTQDGTCRNNGQTTWTYNQGVIASGLAELAVVTGDRSLLTEAEKTLDATIAHLTNNNILRESCDNAQSGGAVCNQDQQLFKGLWTKHLQFYLDAANEASRTDKYRPFLGSQESAVFHFGTNANNDIGSVWYAPDQGGSIFTPKTSASGLEAHVAAAKYGPC
ncbi:Six-hairpin glycosidase [Marasmius fiardii PR-910]|nr:Six-hairpin glycosidase [Marasmius fiardii PR-910]